MTMKTGLLFLALSFWLLAFNLWSTPPSPAGLQLYWETNLAGFSNQVFFVWRLSPLSNRWENISMTSLGAFTNTGTAPDGTLFGVTVLARSNDVVRNLDLGIAAWWPDIRSTNAMTRLTPAGPWSVPTNTWLRKSTDLKTFTQRERFHISGGQVLVEHFETPTEPHFFFAIQTNSTPLPPMPGGAP